IDTFPMATRTTAEIVPLMIGRDVSRAYPPKPTSNGTASSIPGSVNVEPPDSALEVINLSWDHVLNEISLTVAKGEIVGLGGLDLLVSNAARQTQSQMITDITTELFDNIIKTNIYAPFWIIRTAVPHLQPGSAIIATTSEQAYDPNPDLYAYAQTKAATMNFVKSLAKMLGPKGIRVNGVAPGPIYTPLQISGGA
ncbi:SDR family NAD(P)-dependent oxidoreductase, partial [Lacticaseibacillus rhamnosus]